jgi:hypothetical protein
MVKKTVLKYPNPLDWFLNTEPDDHDNLTVLAKRYAAEPFDVDSFRTELVAKLKRLKYQPAKLTGNEKTFYDTLAEAGALDVLLQASTLRELWRCMLLKKIAQRDRQLERENKDADGRELRFHTKQASQIWKDLGAIAEIVKRYSARDEAEKLSKKLEAQYRKHVRILLSSKKYRIPRDVLLSGRTRKELRHRPRDEDLATKKAIYRTLKNKLQTQATKRKGVFDIFLCQLAELVWAPHDVKKLSNGGNLYRNLAPNRSS